MITITLLTIIFIGTVLFGASAIPALIIQSTQDKKGYINPVILFVSALCFILMLLTWVWFATQVFGMHTPQYEIISEPLYRKIN